PPTSVPHSRGATRPPRTLHQIPRYLSSTPRPPRSTLFPYTTLFRSRSSSGRPRPSSTQRSSATYCSTAASKPDPSRNSASRSARSEEQTFELQSPYDLVCRFLLEKKIDLEVPGC